MAHILLAENEPTIARLVGQVLEDAVHALALPSRQRRRAHDDRDDSTVALGTTSRSEDVLRDVLQGSINVHFID